MLLGREREKEKENVLFQWWIQGGSWVSMEPPFARIHVTTLHDCIAVVSLSCKQPLFSDISAAKPTIEAVLDLEIINFLSR